MSGAIFCLSLYHVCPAHSRKSVGSAGFHFGALSEEYPIWNDFLTFSTGFSTGIVKKAPVFPRCFPLFPLSFPHFPVRWFIHGVLYRANLCENQGNYGPLHLFSERKSNPKIYFLQQAENPLVEFLPVGMKEPLIFHTRFLQKSICGKQRENFSFQQKETTLSVIAARCHLSQRARLCCLYLRPAIGSPFGGAGKADRL